MKACPMMETIKLILTLGAALLCLSAASYPHGLRVVDGDTLARGDVRLRLVNLDAPELGNRARCDAERRRGEGSRDYARALIASASSVVVHPSGRVDRYKRPLVRVSVDGRDFAALMIAAGHGRPWRGRSSDWC